MENEFIKVCKYSDLKEKTGKQFFVKDIEIALFKVDGKVYALSNICPHQKTHLMHEGIIEDGKVICPVHGWEFDLQTGNLAKGRKGLEVYDVKIDDDYVYVKVREKNFIW
ncbi:nitrite reductase small subunit NirD [Rosettibacter firmus]|uniref:nitrite reductase small subunit NirD n=1 Tax=Rosettibacter firmus TaxID=3111522 RepID=UPI00336C2F70